MRFLALIALFFVSFYYFWPKNQEESQIDVVKLKSSALHKTSVPERAIANTPTINEETIVETANDKHEKLVATDSSSVEADGLKEYLVRMEPEDGEEIYNSYVNEKDNFDAEFEALNREKESLYTTPEGEVSKKLLKSNKAAILEFETLMTQLEQKHFEKLKDILGVYYDEVMENREDVRASRSIDLPESIEEAI